MRRTRNGQPPVKSLGTGAEILQQYKASPVSRAIRRVDSRSRSHQDPATSKIFWQLLPLMRRYAGACCRLDAFETDLLRLRQRRKYRATELEQLERPDFVEWRAALILRLEKRRNGLSRWAMQNYRQGWNRQLDPNDRRSSVSLTEVVSVEMRNIEWALANARMDARQMRYTVQALDAEITDIEYHREWVQRTEEQAISTKMMMYIAYSFG